MTSSSFAGECVFSRKSTLQLHLLVHMPVAVAPTTNLILLKRRILTTKAPDCVRRNQELYKKIMRLQHY